MPMDRKRYPKNWEAIALKVKTKANWTCQECGKKCLSPDTEIEGLSKSDRARLTLTVHHADYNPANNKRSNLIALCAPCHLAKHKRGQGSVAPGQLALKLKVSNYE